MIYFTSDQHFGHNNIIKYCNRPFSNTKEMNEGIITNFNSKVKTGDTTYHLGDFSFCGKIETERIFRQLNGNHILIIGNHDYSRIKNYVGLFSDMKHIHEFKHNNHYSVLCHFPMLTWHRRNRGSFMLHGHEHGYRQNDWTERRMDVGVDANDFYPLSYEQIYNRLNSIVIPKNEEALVYKN